MKVIKKILIGIGVLALVILFCYFWFHIDNVKVSGTEIYSSQDIEKSVFSRKFSDNQLVFRVYQKIFGINKLPLVEEIEVKYKSHDTVELVVYDKTLSGCIKYMGQFVYFDKDGIVMQSMSEHREGVPIVTGIKFGDFTVGEKFKVDDDSLFDAIMNVSQLVNHYGISVKRIHINNSEITLYSGNIQVFLGKRLKYDEQLAALSSVLETTTSEKLSGTIDMSKYESGDKIILKK